MEFITTMLEEKGLIDEILEIEHEGINHTMPIGVILEFIENAPLNIQNQIKDTLSKIDFMNGDVLHFMRHLAVGIIQL